jgi:hypothetical protein
MWQWECYPHSGQSCWAQPHKAHWHPVSLFERPPAKGRYRSVFYISTENQLADIFTKPLDEKTFCRLRSELNVLDSWNLDWFIAYMCIMLWSCSLMHFVYLWCSSCTNIPRTSQVHVWVMHIFRGWRATTWPFETNRVLEFAWFSLKVDWTGKVDLDHARLPLHSDERVTYSKFISISLLPWYSYLKILVRQWGLGAKIDPVLVLDAKGGENKAKAINWSATTWEILKIVE